MYHVRKLLTHQNNKTLDTLIIHMMILTLALLDQVYTGSMFGLGPRGSDLFIIRPNANCLTRAVKCSYEL